MTQEIALKILWDSCIHNEETKEAYKVLRNDTRPQGEWIEGENGNIKCNQCGCEIRYSYLIGNKPDFPKFCCDCGVEMKGGAEDG